MLRKYDHNDVLDRWSAGQTDKQIAWAIGAGHHSINSIIVDARRRGDSRAAHHGRHRSANMWTDERTEAAQAMWAGGKTAAEIAKALDITRNAVIGKVHRMGWATRLVQVRKKPTDKRSGTPRQRMSAEERAAKARARSQRWRAENGSQPRAPRVPYEPPQPPNMLMLSIMDLQSSNCRFPIGDPKEPGFAFCGSVALDHSYCPFHRALAYQPPESQARRSGNVRYFMRHA